MCAEASGSGAFYDVFIKVDVVVSSATDGKYYVAAESAMCLF